MKKHLLITGGTGYLGGLLIRKLLTDPSINILVLRKKDSFSNHLEDIGPKITFIDIDDDDNEEWQNQLNKTKIDTIIHLATCYGRKCESKEEMTSANLDFPLKLLKLAVKNKVPVFINTDTSLPKETNDYSFTKKEFLHWLKHYSNSESPKIKVANIKLEHFYGPNDGKFISNIIKSFKNHVTKLDLTDGTQKRDFIHCDDVVDAYLKIIDFQFKIGESYFEFEVGSGTSYTIREVITLLKELTDNRVTILNWGAVPLRDNEPHETVANIENIKKLGWSPIYDIQSGLRKVVDE